MGRSVFVGADQTFLPVTTSGIDGHKPLTSWLKAERDGSVITNIYKYGCRCKASIVKRRGQVIYELVREPDI